MGTECKFDVFDVLDSCIFSPCTNPTGYTCRNNGLLYCNGLLQGGTAFSLAHSLHTTVCLTNCHLCFLISFTHAVTHSNMFY